MWVDSCRSQKGLNGRWKALLMVAAHCQAVKILARNILVCLYQSSVTQTLLYTYNHVVHCACSTDLSERSRESTDASER